MRRGRLAWDLSATSPDRLRWVGDPVDVVTGALAEVAGEFSISGAPPIVWQRHYSTARARASMPLGWGQTHEYDLALRMVVDGWLYTGPSGDEILFIYGPADAEIESAGHRLTPMRSGVLELSTPRGELITFDPLDFDRIARPRRIREGGGVLVLDHDRAGRLVRLRDADDARVVTLEYTGDRITALWLAAHPQRPVGAPLALMRYRYDARGDLVEAVDRYGHRQAFAYDEHHRFIARADRAGYRFEYEHDAAGRCVVTRGHDGVQEHRLRYMPEAQATLVTKGDGGEWLYRYDEVGSLTEIIDPRGGVRRFEYDADGNLIRETDPAGNTRSAIVGPAGDLLAWKTSAGGIRPPEAPTGPHPHRVPATPLELDLGDLAARVLQGAPVASAGIAPLFLHGASIFSRLFDKRDPAAEVRRRRDELGLLIDEQSPNATRPRRWSYTPNGWVRRYVDHDGGEYHFHYTSWNHRCAATDPVGRTIRYEYTRAEEIAAVIDPVGNRHEYRYDLQGNLAEVHHSGALLETYESDLGGNLLAKRDARGRVLVRYEIGPDNLKSRRTLASGEEHRYSYTPDGRFSRIDFGPRSLAFTYEVGGKRTCDLRDRRIRKTYGDETTEYFWDTDRLAAELASDGRLRVYVYPDDFALTPWLVIDYDRLDADPASGRLHALVSDQRGAPVLALDADGLCVWSATLAPYGLAETEGELDIRHRLAGQILDPETGLHYNRFRYYSPTLGRFLAEDPAGVGGGLNLYAYTYCPLVSFDARGLTCGECGSDAHESEDCPCRRAPEGVSRRPSADDVRDGCPIAIPEGARVVESGSRRSLPGRTGLRRQNRMRCCVPAIFQANGWAPC